MPRIVIEDLQPGEVVSVSLSDDCGFDPDDGEEIDDETEQAPPLKVVGKLTE